MTIRTGDAADIDFLERMLFEAFFWNAASERPEFAAFRRRPEFTRLVAEWGRQGDRAVIAEESRTPLGAAWFRLWTPTCHSYGFVDSRTPEIGVGVVEARRGQGIGRALLKALIAEARTDGYPAVSLSVSPLNPARMLYESLGFQRVGESGTSWTLRLKL